MAGSLAFTSLNLNECNSQNHNWKKTKKLKGEENYPWLGPILNKFYCLEYLVSATLMVLRENYWLSMDDTQMAQEWCNDHKSFQGRQSLMLLLLLQGRQNVKNLGRDETISLAWSSPSPLGISSIRLRNKRSGTLINFWKFLKKQKIKKWPQCLDWCKKVIKSWCENF